MTEAKECPILFNGPIVRVIQAGDKTQTRRTKGLEYFSRPENDPDGWWCARVADGQAYMVYKHSPHERAVRCPYGQPGDRLSVRETFVQGFEHDEVQDRFRQYDEDGNELPIKTWYLATDPGIRWADDNDWEANIPWRPSIHMPRSACRLVPEVTRVCVERLQAVNHMDALAEGVGLNPAAARHVPRAVGTDQWRRILGHQPLGMGIEFNRIR